MNIADLLSKEAVLPDLKATTQKKVLEELLAPLQLLHSELQHFDVLGALCEREKLGSTAVGEGVALPHTKVPCLQQVVLAAGRSHKGIPFGAQDQSLCHLFFLILAPEQGAGQHLHLLAQIARRAKDAVFRSEVLLAANKEQLWHIITTP